MCQATIDTNLSVKVTSILEESLDLASLIVVALVIDGVSGFRGLPCRLLLPDLPSLFSVVTLIKNNSGLYVTH